MHTPQVAYSVNVRLGGGGMGSSILEMLIGLHQTGLLSQAIVSSCKTDRIRRELITQLGFLGRVQKRLSLYDPTEWLAGYLENRIFDRWASRVMRPANIQQLDWNVLNKFAGRSAAGQPYVLRPRLGSSADCVGTDQS
jgi:hypothetical protein